MTPLRQKMEADLRLRNLSSGTRKLYVRCVARFAQRFSRSPDELGTAEVRAFLLQLAALGRAPSTRVVYHAALRFLYVETLGRPEVMATVPRPRVKHHPPRRPLVKAEARALLDAGAEARRPFDYTVIATLLATGLRVSELCALRPADIDSRAGLVHVRCGKGGKARSVQLGDRLLRLLRRYWVVERIRGPWLFPAQRLLAPGKVDPHRRWAGHPVSPDTVRGRLRRIADAAGLDRRVTPHDLRRTYATWLLEAGEDMRVVQALLGHASPETTARYAQVRPELIRRVPSPLQML